MYKQKRYGHLYWISSDIYKSLKKVVCSIRIYAIIMWEIQMIYEHYNVLSFKETETIIKGLRLKMLSLYC